MPVSRRRRASVGRLAVAAAIVATLVAGCDLRWETPLPTPRSPDAVELARQSVAIDTEELAGVAARSASGAAEGVRPALIRIASHAQAQLAQLGGVYVDPDASPTTSPTAASSVDPPGNPTASATTSATTGPTASATTSVGTGSTESSAPVPPAPDPGAVMARLAESYGSTRSAAMAVTDGDLGRLFASISADRIIQAQELARLAVLDVPALAPVEIPTVLPGGLPASAAAELAEAEDQAGYAIEVSAALRSEAQRDAARARAAIHRDRAQAWAEVAGVAGTSQDPRRVAYAIDRSAAAGGLPGTVEATLAARYAALVATVEPAQRGIMIDGLADCAAAARDWAAAPTAFPGLPEQPADEPAAP